ncbi:MAG: 16S rRNA (guanine(527)-N(7))-methyltransferase RsmG [Nitrospirae bacterium]|nr:16S rRNA (guanine(527)-N(7))-methyltransferase RsmG [Nitrospirota bacterium]
MNPKELLKEGLNQIGISYSEEQIKSFLTYLSELKKWNRVYNLTALKTDEDIVVKHFLDSLLYLKAILKESFKSQVSSFKLKNSEVSELKIADVGTGAGFPGIPIKLTRPEIELTLIEPSRKKSAFLRHIVRALKLKNVTVLEARLEDLPEEQERNYDIIVSRAIFKVKDFLKMACPYLKGDGILVLSKGPKVSEELNEALLDSAFIKGADTVAEIFRLELPFINAKRNLLILKCKP